MMFDINVTSEGIIKLRGRLDSNQVDRVREVLVKVSTTTKVDFGDLRYISSAGLGILLSTQKRLAESGNRLDIINMTPHIRDIFSIAGFDFIFDLK